MRIGTKVAPEEMKKKERIQEIFKGTHCSSPQITDRMQMKRKRKQELLKHWLKAIKTQ